MANFFGGGKCEGTTGEQNRKKKKKIKEKKTRAFQRKRNSWNGGRNRVRFQQKVRGVIEIRAAKNAFLWLYYVFLYRGDLDRMGGGLGMYLALLWLTVGKKPLPEDLLISRPGSHVLN